MHLPFLPLMADALEEVLPHEVFSIGTGPGAFVVTNQMLMAVVAAVLMLLIFPALFSHAKEAAEVPTGSRNFFEAILEFLRVEVFRPALKENTDRFVPFLWTLFFFILFSNLLGQIPFNAFVSLFTHKESFAGGTATGTLTTTGALAVCAFIMIHISGILQVARSLMDGTYGHHGHHEEHSSEGTHVHPAAHDEEHVRGEALPADVPADFRALGNPTKHYADEEHLGHHHAKADEGDLHGQGHEEGPKVNPVAAVLLALPLYIWNFAPHPFKPAADATGIGAFIMRLLDVGMWAFLLVLELIGALIKPFALMIRLFANMIAGHIVLGALIVLIPVGASALAMIGVGIPVTALSLLIRVLEVFVAFLQAYIFTFLTTLFIAAAVAPEH
jgi:F0F1-type ATP synthase membrane subunit a